MLPLATCHQVDLSSSWLQCTHPPAHSEKYEFRNIPKIETDATSIGPLLIGRLPNRSAYSLLQGRRQSGTVESLYYNSGNDHHSSNSTDQSNASRMDRHNN